MKRESCFLSQFSRKTNDMKKIALKILPLVFVLLMVISAVTVGYFFSKSNAYVPPVAGSNFNNQAIGPMTVGACGQTEAPTFANTAPTFDNSYYVVLGGTSGLQLGGIGGNNSGITTEMSYTDEFAIYYANHPSLPTQFFCVHNTAYGTLPEGENLWVCDDGAFAFSSASCGVSEFGSDYHGHWIVVDFQEQALLSSTGCGGGDLSFYASVNVIVNGTTIKTISNVQLAFCSSTVPQLSNDWFGISSSDASLNPRFDNVCEYQGYVTEGGCFPAQSATGCTIYSCSSSTGSFTWINQTCVGGYTQCTITLTNTVVVSNGHTTTITIGYCDSQRGCASFSQGTNYTITDTAISIIWVYDTTTVTTTETGIVAPNTDSLLYWFMEIVCLLVPTAYLDGMTIRKGNVESNTLIQMTMIGLMVGSWIGLLINVSTWGVAVAFTILFPVVLWRARS